MKVIKFRLIRNGEIVGYEMFHEDRWIYAYPGENFSLHTPFIPHDTKDFFTNLKDKNGKDIYEGDIVEDENSQYKIVFDKCCFWGINEMNKYPIYQIFHYIMENEKFEVICNIYENSELIKSKK